MSKARVLKGPISTQAVAIVSQGACGFLGARLSREAFERVYQRGGASLPAGVIAAGRRHRPRVPEPGLDRPELLPLREGCVGPSLPCAKGRPPNGNRHKRAMRVELTTFTLAT